MLRRFLLVESIARQVRNILLEAVEESSYVPSDVLSRPSDKPFKDSSRIKPGTLDKHFPGLQGVLTRFYSKDTYEIGLNNKLVNVPESIETARKLGNKILSDSVGLPESLLDTYVEKFNRAKDFHELFTIITGLLMNAEYQEKLNRVTLADPNLEKLFDLETYVDSTGVPLSPDARKFEIKNRIYALAGLDIETGGSSAIKVLSEQEIMDLKPGDIIAPTDGMFLVSYLKDKAKYVDKSFKASRVEVELRPVFVYSDSKIRVREKVSQDPETGMYYITDSFGKVRVEPQDVYFFPGTRVEVLQPVYQNTDGTYYVTSPITTIKVTQSVKGGGGAAYITGTPHSVSSTGYSSTLESIEFKYPIDELLDYNYARRVKQVKARAVSDEGLQLFTPDMSPIFTLVDLNTRKRMKNEVDKVQSSNPEEYFNIVKRYITQYEKEGFQKHVKNLKPNFHSQQPGETYDNFNKRIEQYNETYDTALAEKTNEIIQKVTYKTFIDVYDPMIVKVMDREAKKYEEGSGKYPGGRTPEVFQILDGALSKTPKGDKTKQSDLPSIQTVLTQLTQGRGIVDKSFEKFIFDQVKNEAIQSLTKKLENIRAGDIALLAFKSLLQDLEYSRPRIEGGSVVDEGVFLGEIESYLEAVEEKIDLQSQGSVYEDVLGLVKKYLIGSPTVPEDGMVYQVHSQDINSYPKQKILDHINQIKVAETFTQLREALEKGPMEKLSRKQPGIASPEDILARLEEIVGKELGKIDVSNQTTKDTILNTVEETFRYTVTRELPYRLEAYLKNLPRTYGAEVSKTSINKALFRIKLSFREYIFTSFIKKDYSKYDKETIRNLTSDVPLEDIYEIAVEYLGPEEGVDRNLNNMYEEVENIVETRLKDIVNGQTYTDKVKKDIIQKLTMFARLGYRGYDEFITTQFPAIAIPVTDLITKVKSELVGMVRTEVYNQLNKVTLVGEPLVIIQSEMADDSTHTLSGIGAFILILTGTISNGLYRIVTSKSTDEMRTTLLNLMKSSSLRKRTTSGVEASIYGTEQQRAWGGQSVLRAATSMAIRDLPVQGIDKEGRPIKNAARPVSSRDIEQSINRILSKGKK